MITYQQALSIILASTEEMGIEKVSISESLHRVLAEDIFSDTDLPPFDKSAMDGYACRMEDINLELEVIEEIPAGKVPDRKIDSGQCAKIMTGAIVPDGANCVVMIEDTEIISNGIIKTTCEKTKKNICFKGEDVKKGMKVLDKGICIKPQHIAVLASVGATSIKVVRIPKVAVLSTGNELVEPSEKPDAGQIRNSNAYQLMAQCKRIGIDAEYAGIAFDDKQTIKNRLSALLDTFDVVLVSGGVSMGDYDFVPEILAELGMTLLVRGMKVKPGKRVIAAKKTNKTSWAFGIPGNPVSSFVLFETLIKPFLLKLCGQCITEKPMSYSLEDNYKRKDSDKMGFVPVVITREGLARCVEYHGSAHIHAYAGATGIMEIPEGVNEIKKGENVYVRQV